VFGGKMKTLKIMIVLVIICSLFLVACGKKKKSKSTGPERPYVPTWWNVQDSGEFVYTYGFAEKTSQRAADASADAMARAAAAVYVENHVQTMTKDFLSEVGSGHIAQLTEQVTKFTANATFSGTMRSKEETITLPNGEYKVWVRLQIPKDTINRDFLNRVREQEELYNRFRADQAFQELERSLNR
jgi:hypothetical protein